MITDVSIRIYGFLTNLVRREEGQDLLEYALLGGGIALAIITGFVLFDDRVTDMVTGIGRCIDFNSSTTCNPGW